MRFPAVEISEYLMQPEGCFIKFAYELAGNRKSKQSDTAAGTAPDVAAFLSSGVFGKCGTGTNFFVCISKNLRGLLMRILYPVCRVGFSPPSIDGGPRPTLRTGDSLAEAVAVSAESAPRGLSP